MRTIQLADLPSLAGQETGVSDWVEVTQDMIDAFAEVTGDHQWIHVDRERAAAEIGGTVAHGFLTLSLLSQLAARTLHVQGWSRGLNYGFDKVRFTDVVPAGSRVRLRETLLAVEPIEGGYAVRRGCTVETEGRAKPALVAEWLTRLYA